MKQEQIKQKVLDELGRTPVVEIACKRSGVSRSSFYRWKLEDKDFAKKIDDAISEGELLINDLAESKLIASIQDQSLSAIVFWLKNHHDKYKQKLEITGQLEHMQKELTPEQKKVVEQALKLSSLITEENIKKLNSKDYEKQKINPDKDS